MLGRPQLTSRSGTPALQSTTPAQRMLAQQSRACTLLFETTRVREVVPNQCDKYTALTVHTSWYVVQENNNWPQRYMQNAIMMEEFTTWPSLPIICKKKRITDKVAEQPNISEDNTRLHFVSYNYGRWCPYYYTQSYCLCACFSTHNLVYITNPDLLLRTKRYVTIEYSTAVGKLNARTSRNVEHLGNQRQGSGAGISL